MKQILFFFAVMIFASALVKGVFASPAIKDWPSGIFDTVPLQTASVGDITVGYKIFGAGEPLILIMGYSGTMDMWAPKLLEELSKRYKVIVFDNRGMGKTTAGFEVFTIERFADDTAGLMDALKIESAGILGYSMGTNIAQELVLRYPGKVKKLILCAADCGGKESIPPSGETIKALNDFSGLAQQRGEGLLKVMFPAKWLKENPVPFTYFPKITEKSPIQSIMKQAKAMGMWKGAYARLPEITRDTLLITGTEDAITLPENSFVMLKQIKGAWLAQFKASAHGAMYQYPEEFAELINAFLN